jgi:hypothetical protein
MFIGVQKLELFSEHKSPELGQFLNLAGLQPLICSEFACRDSFDANFLVNLSFDRRSARFKSSNFDAFGIISRLVAQWLG